MKKLGRKVTVGRSHAPSFTPPFKPTPPPAAAPSTRMESGAGPLRSTPVGEGPISTPARGQQEGREKESTSCLAVLLAARPPRCAAPASPSLWRWRPPVAVAVAEATRRPRKTSTSLSLILKLGASNSVNLKPLILDTALLPPPGKTTST